MEGDMASQGRNQRVSRDAAVLAIKWKSAFASELQKVAHQVARDSETISVDHYQQALPQAVENLLRSVKKESAHSNVQENAA